MNTDQLLRNGDRVTVTLTYLADDDAEPCHAELFLNDLIQGHVPVVEWEINKIERKKS